MIIDRSNDDAPVSISDQNSGGVPTSWLSQHRWLAALTVGTVMAALAGLLVVYLFVPEYSASGLIMIEDEAPYIAFASDPSISLDDHFVQGISKYCAAMCY